MRIEKLKDEVLQEFLAYCRKYGPEHDDSYLFEEELNNFKLDEDNPTYVLLDEGNCIVGAASLMIDSYYKKGRKARFRIFHSIKPEREPYELMLKALLPYTNEIDRLYLFIPEERDRVRSIFESIGFGIERYSFLMTRDGFDVPEYKFPDGYELKTFKFGRDEKDWCDIRNEGFAKLAGSETPMTIEMVSEMEHWDGSLDGGMMFLCNNKKPIGLIRVSMDTYNSNEYAYIGPIIVLPAYQGMGLGRNLLRTGLMFGKDKGLNFGLLTVNAENDNALKLYLHEGFKKEQTIVCYNYDIER